MQSKQEEVNVITKTSISLPLYTQGDQEDETRHSPGNYCIRRLANTDLVSNTVINLGTDAHSSPAICKFVDDAIQTRTSPVEIALQLFFSQNSNHFFAVDWYRDFVPSLQEFKIMSIVSLEKPFTCNFSQIQDK